MSPKVAASAGALVAVLAAAGRADSQIRLGPDFQANTYTTYGQRLPSVALDANGNFVIVWQSRFQDGYEYGVFGRRYDAAGAPLAGSEFRVNTQTMYAQVYPRVASSATGQLIVAWNSPGDGDLNGVFARRFSAAGAPVGLDFAVNTYTSWSQRFPAVASDPAGNAVVVWQSFSQDGSDEGVFGQRYDAQRRATGRRVPGQHAYDERPAPAERGHGRQRTLRRGLGEPGPGRKLQRHRRSTLRRRRRAAGWRFRGELVHLRQPVQAFGRQRRRRQLRGDLGLVPAGREPRHPGPAVQRHGCPTRRGVPGEPRRVAVCRIRPGRLGSRRKLHGGLDGESGRGGHGRVRPPLRCRRRGPGRRVPGQRLHDGLSDRQRDRGI